MKGLAVRVIFPKQIKGGEPMEVEFEYERDTKRMYRFQETSEEPVIGYLYVKKAAFSSQPKKLKVTVEVLEE